MKQTIMSHHYSDGKILSVFYGPTIVYKFLNSDSRCRICVSRDFMFD